MHEHADSRHFLQFFVNTYDKMNLLIKKDFCSLSHLWLLLRPLHHIITVLSFVAAAPSAANRRRTHLWLPLAPLHQIVAVLSFVAAPPIFVFKILYENLEILNLLTNIIIIIKCSARARKTSARACSKNKVA